jgi:hypothetical protein
MEEAPILHSEASGVRVFDGPGRQEAVRMAYLQCWFACIEMVPYRLLENR